MRILKGSVLFICCMLLSISCGDNTTDTGNDNYDRSALLANIADNIIIPSYQVHNDNVIRLDESFDAFKENSTIVNLASLRQSFITAYSSWQTVSMFQIGKSEEIDLRGYSNIFPTSPEKINDFALNGSYNLELPSTRDAQGFPALDYLLYGTGLSDEDVLEQLSDSNFMNYTEALIERLVELTNTVNEDWSTYRDVFANNDGTSATSSINKLVNDYLFYYEKFLRAGKVGIPAGVFSSSPLSDLVEAPYSAVYSKDLLLQALESAESFFEGKHTEGDAIGEGLVSYLDFLDTNTDGEKLSKKIMDQFDNARLSIQELNNDLSSQVEDDNMKMLSAYDELQKNVVYLKVDMLQALNIKVDYVDADGD